MKFIFKPWPFALGVLLLFGACEKDPVLTYLDVIPFPPALISTASSVVLTPAKDDSTVIGFSWPSVTYKIEAPVTYTIQFTVPSDTIGSTAWSKSVKVEVGKDVLAKYFKGSELNNIAINSLGLVKDSVNTVVARVAAYMDRPVYSNAVTFTVNPYKVTVLAVLHIPGDYQGWNPSAAPVIREANGKPKMFEGYVYIPAGGSYQFKMTPQPDWTPMAYGDASGNSGNIIEANYAGGNMSVSQGGYYYLTANLNTFKWTATKTTWSIIGDATPGGWGGDTQLAYDEAAKVWKLTCNMLKNGSFKFRANNEWVIDFGVDNNGKLTYADNPFLGYTPNVNNLSVPEDGNYTITLDLHDAGNYTYILKKN